MYAEMQIEIHFIKFQPYRISSKISRGLFFIMKWNFSAYFRIGLFSKCFLKREKTIWTTRFF